MKNIIREEEIIFSALSSSWLNMIRASRSQPWCNDDLISQRWFNNTLLYFAHNGKFSQRLLLWIFKKRMKTKRWKKEREILCSRRIAEKNKRRKVHARREEETREKQMRRRRRKWDLNWAEWKENLKRKGKSERKNNVIIKVIIKLRNVDVWTKGGKENS